MVDGAAALAEIVDQFGVTSTLGTGAQFFGNQRSQRLGTGEFAQKFHCRQHFHNVIFCREGICNDAGMVVGIVGFDGD